MKTKAAFFMAALLASQVLAQDVKVFGGADWGRYRTPPGFVPIPEVSYGFRWKPGFVLGAGIEFPLFSGFGADVALLYAQRGTVDETRDPRVIPGFARNTYRLAVISLPACAKLKPFAQIPPYVLAGAELSYVLEHSRLSFTGGPEPGRQDLQAATRRWDVGVVVGGGLEFPVTAGWSVFTEVRYSYGLLNLARPAASGTGDPLGLYTGNLKTRTLSLLAGVACRLFPGSHGSR